LGTLPFLDEPFYFLVGVDRKNNAFLDPKKGLIMDKKQLHEIKTRLAAATKGKWMVTQVEGQYSSDSRQVSALIESGGQTYSLPLLYPSSGINHEDLDFVAHARQDIPDLLKEVERLTAEGNKALSRNVEIRIDLQSAFTALEEERKRSERLTKHAEQLYREGHITLSKLAELLGISLIEARDTFGVPLGLDDLPEEDFRPPPAVYIIARCVPIQGAHTSEGNRVERLVLQEGDAVRLAFSNGVLHVSTNVMPPLESGPDLSPRDLPPDYRLRANKSNAVESYCPEWCSGYLPRKEAVMAAWEHYRENGGT
jgi:hypothetical protein